MLIFVFSRGKCSHFSTNLVNKEKRLEYIKWISVSDVFNGVTFQRTIGKYGLLEVTLWFCNAVHFYLTKASWWAFVVSHCPSSALLSVVHLKNLMTTFWSSHNETCLECLPCRSLERVQTRFFKSLTTSSSQRKTFKHSGGHSLDSDFMNLSQNVFLDDHFW